ncbi:hypothetical protein FS763_06300 [Agrobacterium vitis]|nr:hypothetical protein [Allorhizobium ampelinum]
MSKVLPPSVLLDISPSRGEIGWGRPVRPKLPIEIFAFCHEANGRNQSATSLISPLEGEMVGRPEGGIPRHTISISKPIPAPEKDLPC